MLAKLNVTMVSLPFGEQFRYYTHRDYLPSLAESKSLILFISWNKKIFGHITNENINNSQFNVRNESTKLSQMHNKKLNFSSNLDQAYILIFRRAESAPCQNYDHFKYICSS